MTTSNISRVRRTAVAAALLIGVAGSTATASASARRHLRVLRSAPAADTVLTAAPKSISLWTSERVELTATKLTLATPAGVKAVLGKPSRAEVKGAPVVVPISGALTPGKWHVTWRTMSNDGHVVNGAFDFQVAK